MKRNMVCNFRGIMMTALMIFLSIMLMLFSGGCGKQQQDRTEDVRELVATGGAVYVDGDQDVEEVQEQLELLAKNVDKWRIDGGKKKSLETSYAVTDLDHNGRLEIMALSYDWREEDGYILRKCFEVNSSGDGIQEIGTEQIQGIPLSNYVGNYGAPIEKLSTAYFDPETGKYHYVMEGMLDEDEDIADIIALTLTDGQIIKTTLGTWEQSGKKAEDIRYFRVDARGKTEITKEEYSVEKLGTLSYANCGKFDVWYSAFTYEHDLEEHIYHAMEKAYEKCFQGYPLEKREKKIQGHTIAVPQYATMQDSGKQKRINRMICEQVEQSLSDAYGDLQDAEFDLEYTNITIKYAGRNRVSLLLEARGYHEGAVTANEHCDTINIDLEQEKLLTGQDILPEQYREEVEEEIEEEIEEGDAEGFHGGKDYQKWLEEKEADLFPTMRAEGWQDVKIYQTRDEVGVVIPIKFGLDAYVIYEISRDWNVWVNDKGIAYSDIDWEEYQYKLLPSEYQSLQSYMPLLTGESEFALLERTWSEMTDEWEKGKSLRIVDLATEYGGDDFPLDALILSSISICDMTQDGEAELVLKFSSLGGLYLILHKEGDAYYGITKGIRSLYGIRKNGVYYGGRYGEYFYRLRFEKGTFVDTYIGGYTITIEEETYSYHIGDQDVKKGEYKKWEKSIAAEEVLWYTPEILWEKIEKLKSEL